MFPALESRLYCLASSRLFRYCLFTRTSTIIVSLAPADSPFVTGHHQTQGTSRVPAHRRHGGLRVHRLVHLARAGQVRHHTGQRLDGGGAAHRRPAPKSAVDHGPWRQASRAQRVVRAFYARPTLAGTRKAYGLSRLRSPSSYFLPLALCHPRTVPTAARSARLGSPCRDARLCSQRRLLAHLLREVPPTPINNKS